MKSAKKIISVMLAVVMCLTALSAAVYAADEKKSVTIFVDGINSSNVINTDTGEVIFPPSTESIVGAVASVAPDLILSVLDGDYSNLKDPLVNAVLGVLNESACDEYGIPKVDSDSDYEWPSEKSIKKIAENDDDTDFVWFSYDWRLSMQTLAGQLHSFIEYVMDAADLDSVSLIGFSMGTCVVLSYLEMYDYEYVDSVIFFAGGYNGASCCGQPFAGMIKLDSDAVVRFVDAMMGEDFGAVVVKTLLHTLNAAGIMDSVIDIGTDMVDRLSDAVYSEVFTKTFATYPGMWALIPAEYYEAAKETLMTADFPQEYIDTIDWYHNVQLKADEIMQGCLDRGLNFAIIAKYGFPNTPCIEDINSMSDGVIDTRLESFGATCADVNTTLGEDYVQAVDNGHDCISADNMIDSSTCKFCDYTWFIKNIVHADWRSYQCILDMFAYILHADEQPTVWDGEYDQFLTVVDGELETLTAENSEIIYTVDPGSESMWKVFINMIKSLFTLLKNLIASAFGK